MSMQKKLTAQEALRRTGLYHEYQRMVALDPRVPGMMTALLAYAEYCEPGDTEPLLIKALRAATDKVRWHFRESDPNIAASLARDDYWRALEDLKQRLFEQTTPLYQSLQQRDEG